MRATSTISWKSTKLWKPSGSRTPARPEAASVTSTTTPSARRATPCPACRSPSTFPAKRSPKITLGLYSEWAQKSVLYGTQIRTSPYSPPPVSPLLWKLEKDSFLLTIGIAAGHFLPLFRGKIVYDRESARARPPEILRRTPCAIRYRKHRGNEIAMQILSLQRRYGFVLLAVGTAWGATLLLQSVMHEKSFSLVFFFAAVTLSAGVGGLWPGVLATLLSALLCDYFFLTPYHSLSVARSDLPLLVLFLLVALLINGLSARLRAATQVADRRFHDLVQNLEAIVWEGNPRTLQFTFVSQRAEALLGYPARRWLADSDFRQRILHPDDQEEVLARYRKAVEETGEHDLEYRVLTAEGREVWLRETIHVIRDDGGQDRKSTRLNS